MKSANIPFKTPFQNAPPGQPCAAGASNVQFLTNRASTPTPVIRSRRPPRHRCILLVFRSWGHDTKVAPVRGLSEQSRAEKLSVFSDGLRNGNLTTAMSALMPPAPSPAPPLTGHKEQSLLRSTPFPPPQSPLPPRLARRRSRRRPRPARICRGWNAAEQVAEPLARQPLRHRSNHGEAAPEGVDEGTLGRRDENAIQHRYSVREEREFAARKGDREAGARAQRGTNRRLPPRDFGLSQCRAPGAALAGT